MIEDNALQKVIKKYGIDNLTFRLPSRPLHSALGLFAYTTSSDPEIEVNASITEERYKIDEGYKITLKPYAPNFPKEHFYQSDLISMIRRGSVKVEDLNGNPVDLE